MTTIQSKKVNAWRSKTKSIIINIMGGKCIICGYCKSTRALALHHLVPSEKEFQISSIKASRFAWSKIIKELQKCILVCHNCHCEIHDGLVIISNKSIIDDKFFNYDYAFSIHKKDKLYDECPICHKSKPIQLKHCSKECANRSQYKVLWDEIDLVEELKNKTAVQLASELGCSDVAIHKRLKKYKY